MNDGEQMHIALIAQAIFFTMQNVSIPFQNCYAKSWNLA
jgi:hypothetical protein